METISYRVEYVQEDLWHLITRCQTPKVSCQRLVQCGIVGKCAFDRANKTHGAVKTRASQEKAGNCTLQGIVS